MAKVTAKYEVMYMLDPALGEDGIAACKEKFQGLVQTHGTLLGEPEDWGKRRLAYPINDLPDGYYVLMNFESPPEFPKELDRVFQITEGVMRSLIVCKDE